MHKMLDEIIAKRKETIIGKSFSLATAYNKKKRSFKEAFLKLNKDEVGIIGELKFASPTSPELGDKKSFIKIAKEYEKGGVVCLSIITEPKFFQGELGFIDRVRKAVSIPVLQKDFVIDEYQVLEAAATGSDALLFITRILSKKKLISCVLLAKELGVEPVVEIHSEDDLEKAFKTSTEIIAVNARDLDTFAVDVEKACAVLQQIPSDYLKLGFSGIQTETEVKKYKNAGARGVLVGTNLMKAENKRVFINSLRNI